jgi:hypothetical protein
MPPVDDAHLTDLATLKRWMNIAVTDVAADDILNRLIIATSATFLELINHKYFFEQTVSEVYSGDGSSRIRLNLRPVTAVTSVSSGGQLLNPSETYYQGHYAWDAYGLIAINSSFSKFKQYLVAYTGGYALTSKEAYMAEQAVISLCNLWWKRRTHADQTAQSMGQQVTAKFTEEELPPETKAIVRQLQRFR